MFGAAKIVSTAERTDTLVSLGWTKRRESKAEVSYTSPSGKVQVWTRSGWAASVEVSVGERRARCMHHMTWIGFAMRAESILAGFAA